MQAWLRRCRSKTPISRLEAWLANELRPWFSDRLLDVDEDVLVIWRRLVEEGRHF
jgi:hypothetical protein